MGMVMKADRRDSKNKRATARDMERTDTMKKTSLALLAAGLLVVTGCKKDSNGNSVASSSSNNSNTTVAQSNMTPEELGELGAKIKKSPKEAGSLLSQHGMSEQSFEQAVRKVAESPEQSKRYAAAYKKAS